MKMSKKRLSLLILLFAFAAMQFVQVDKTNPSSDPALSLSAMVDIPSDVDVVLKAACYDCHSHETKYPWYFYISPFSWWLKGHINGARENMNFSIWGTYSAEDAAHILEECAEEVEEGKMPLKSYTWGHPEARLSAEQKTLLINWFNSASGNGSEQLNEINTESDEEMDLEVYDEESGEYGSEDDEGEDDY